MLAMTTMGMMMAGGLVVALFVVALVIAVRRSRPTRRADLLVTCVPSKHGPDWIWAVEAPEVTHHGTARTWGAAQQEIRRAERKLGRASQLMVATSTARRAKAMCTGCMQDVDECECTGVGVGIGGLVPVYSAFELVPAAPRRAR